MLLLCRRLFAETKDTAGQQHDELASEERFAGVQHSLREDHVVVDAEREDGVIVGACRL